MPGTTVKKKNLIFSCPGQLSNLFLKLIQIITNGHLQHASSTKFVSIPWNLPTHS